MSRALLALMSLLIVAASPATDEARSLLEAGDESGAFALIESASARDDADAIDYLAWFYDQGRHVPQDRARAAIIYRRAAELGQRHAQWRLGVMLDTGDGTAEDPAEAFRWISRAAAQGSPAALVSLGVMYARGRGVARDYARSRQFYLAAARLGQSHGFYGVGVLHRNGEGVPQSRQEALAWFLCAATMGDDEGQRAAEQIQLGASETAAAVTRANAIFREMGFPNNRVEFRNHDDQST